METISFALGVASVLVVLLGTITVWVTLRVKNLTKENLNLITTINSLDQKIDRRFENLEHHYSDEIREIHDTINVRTDGVYIRIKEETESIHRHMEFLGEKISRSSDDCLRYTDSRIDKLVNNPKFCLNKDKELLTD
jgi:predicted PurR-regulated permease PerM